MISNFREQIAILFFRFFQTFHLEQLLFKVMLHRKRRAYAFLDYFKDFETVEVVNQIFRGKTIEVLRNLKVEFSLLGGYMWINNANGHLVVNSRYLSQGNKLYIYLDLVHELVHVKQFLEGQDLFDTAFSCSERRTEIEAYRYAVTEARRLGLDDKRICRYLETEWLHREDLIKLATILNVTCS